MCKVLAVNTASTLRTGQTLVFSRCDRDHLFWDWFLAQDQHRVEFTRAGYDANVAGYRQTVLSAFQEVEDDVTGLSVLIQAQQSQQHPHFAQSVPLAKQRPKAHGNSA